MSIIEATNIDKVYAGIEHDITVLNNVSLTVNEGEVVAILGPSGAGKSTLMHIIGGLDKPTRGKVILNGESLYELKDNALAYKRSVDIGFIFQFYYLLPEFTALENVVIPLMIKENVSSPDSVKERGIDLLKKVGLSHRMTHKPNQLSGGEQQRVAIARALVNQPKVLLCDEPTGNLDSANGQGIMDLLLSINRDFKQTLVIVTHDHTLAGETQRQVYINDGVIKDQKVTNGK